MRLHGNAELSLNERRRLATSVQQDGWTLTKAAEAAEVSVRTAREWVHRYRAEGEPDLLDRSSRPYSSPNATPGQHVALIALVRRSTRMTGAEIAEVLQMPITTVQGSSPASGRASARAWTGSGSFATSAHVQASWST